MSDAPPADERQPDRPPLLPEQVSENPPPPANVLRVDTVISPPSPREEQQQQPSPKPVQSQSGSSPSPSGRPGSPFSGRHPKYRGIRSRSGKWVSEIREPRKTTRIWLGTYPTPEMAAAAYDVAAIALKGPDTALNFPDSIFSCTIPASKSASDIRAAAAAAARLRERSQAAEKGQSSKQEATDTASGPAAFDAVSGEEFVDEEALLNYPNLLVDMAEGMLMSPPRVTSPSSEDSPENSEGDRLWSYT